MGLKGRTPEEKIKVFIEDVAIAQTIIDLASKEGASLDVIAALFEKKINAYQIQQWLLNGVKLDSAVILLNHRIDSPVVAQLNETHIPIQPPRIK